MALTDTFVRQVKHTGKPTGDKYTDGGGMYLLVKAAGRYWRLDYTHADKRKTLALGVYPEVSLSKARQRRASARELLAEGLDPSAAKRAEKLATRVAAANTFEAVAREFHATQASGWSPRYGSRWIERMEKDLFPYIGKLTLPAITAPYCWMRCARLRNAAPTKPPTPYARQPDKCSATVCKPDAASAAP